MANEQPKSMHLGETKELVLIFTKSSDGARLNLDSELDAGADAIELQVKVLEGDADPALIALAIGTGITKRTQTGDDLGVADAAIPSSATLGGSWPAAPANVGVFRYDVKIILASGAVKYPVNPSDLIVRAVVNGA
jgi:hypothetical protein